MDGAAHGIINGSLIMFGLMFLSRTGIGTRMVRLGLPARDARNPEPVNIRPSAECGLDQMGDLDPAGNSNRVAGNARGRIFPVDFLPDQKQAFP